jgi:hypothetical protein
MIKRKCILLAILIEIITNPAFCQLDNRSFYEEINQDTLSKGEYKVHLDYAGFLKNNEYFTKITDGYTLFGTHITPTIQYQIHPNFKISAGAFLWKNFGENGIHQLEPIFTARFHKGTNQLLMGTLDGGLSHNLIEPLYDFENQWLRRLENGFQWKHKSSNLELDTWVDWRNMITQNSNEQEKIVGGLNVGIQLLEKDKFKITAIFQGTAYHQGGQIDTTRLPLTTWFNGATGISATWDIGKEGAIHNLNFQGFLVGFKDNSNTLQLPFSSGKAFYLTALAKAKWIDVMVNYWEGNQFTTLQGGKLFRSISSNIKEPGYYEKTRKLILIRMLKDFKIAENLFISARLEPYYDLSNKFWEFSHGLFFTYRGNLAKSKTKS